MIPMNSTWLPEWFFVSYIKFQQFYYDATFLFFIFVNTVYLFVLFLGYLNARRQFLWHATGIIKRLHTLKSLKPISILVPCYNEEKTVIASVHAMLTVNYPDYEIIVCNDGSKDGTMNILLKSFNLVPISFHPPHVLASQQVHSVYKSMEFSNLTVIDKENGGKADALNACINYSQYPLICCVDSDSIIDNNGLLQAALPFMSNDDTIATGGTILLANTVNHESNSGLTPVNSQVTGSWLGNIQSIEYLRSFLVGRMGWDLLGCNAIISGAFGLFKKSLVIKVGGYAHHTIGEDMELVVRMQRYCIEAKEPFQISLLLAPVCWTEPPSDLKTLGNQRSRWAQGLAETLWAHRGLMFRPSGGLLGNVAMPFLLLFELLSAPMEILGLLLIGTGVAIGVLDTQRVLLFLLATIGFGWALNLGSIVIDQCTFKKYHSFRDMFLILCGALGEHLGFRQMHLYWRLRGLYRWLAGKHSWGEQRRVGVSKSSQ